MKYFGGTFFFMFLTASIFGQTKTINRSDNSDREINSAHRAMIIPFEPKLYFGEIDRHIHTETNMSSREIMLKFRDGLNAQLGLAFKLGRYNVIDLMDDTAKYKKDIEGIYQYLAYEYQKVPDQENYHPPKTEKKEKKIEKGQLNVETRGEACFMNARLTNPKVVPLLYGKYKTDIFVFINELDIRAAGVDPNLGMATGNRKIVVHYTVYTFDGKEINSGIAEQEFDATLNNPKKIIDKYFSKLAGTIVQRVNKALQAPVK